LIAPLQHILKSIQDPTELDQVTTLPNGIRVATESLPGPFSGVGVYIDAGSRYEHEDLHGVSHIVDRLAFKVGHVKSIEYTLSRLIFSVNKLKNLGSDARVPRDTRRKHTMRFI
jgi:predicted Zn-dependent peptidase